MLFVESDIQSQFTDFVEYYVSWNHFELNHFNKNKIFLKFNLF